MGIDFRGKTYSRDVSLGKRTIKDGEAAAVWDQYGRHREIIGPRLQYLWFSTIRFLDRFAATHEEYLIIHYKNGTVEHKRGPCVEFENPVRHRLIEIKPAIALASASECIVVTKEVGDPSYREKGEARRIERVVIHGPEMYFPSVGEKMMPFNWLDEKFMKSASTFYTLNTSLKQWKVEAPLDVNESLRGTLSLTLSYSISNVEVLVDNTKDLIQDMYDALLVDLTNFTLGSKVDTMTSDDISTQIASLSKYISSMESFPTLMSFSKRVGVSLTDVTFRSFKLHESLIRQALDVTEAKKRIIRDRLHAEEEEKKICAELNARQERLEKEHELAVAELNQKRKMLDAENGYKILKQQYEAGLIEKENHGVLEDMKERNNEALRVLQSMKDMGVDLTKILSEGDGFKNKVILGGGDNTVTRGMELQHLFNNNPM